MACITCRSDIAGVIPGPLAAEPPGWAGSRRWGRRLPRFASASGHVPRGHRSRGRCQVICITIFFLRIFLPLVRRCNGTTAGPGYQEVDQGYLAKILPWAVNLCPHYQAVGYVDSLHGLLLKIRQLPCRYWATRASDVQVAGSNPMGGMGQFYY